MSSMKKHTAATKPIPQHFDLLGREITMGSVVAAPCYSGLMVAKVCKLNPKMIGISRLPSNGSSHLVNKYPCDLVMIDSTDVTFYLLKHTGG